MQSQVVFLVHHDAHLVLHQQRGARTRRRLPLQPGELLTHEMPFVQELALAPLLLVEVECHGGRQPVGRRRGFRDTLEHGPPVGVLGALAEWYAADIPGEADAGGQNDRRFRTGRVQPAHPAIRQQRQVHYSSTRMRSRSSAASSKFSPSTARRSCAFSSRRRLRGSSPTLSPGTSYRSPTCWLEPCSRRSRSRRWVSNDT